MLACMTGLRRGIEAVNLEQGASVPLGFVFQLTDELTPADITDRFRQAVVLDQVLNRQALDANHLVFVHDACAELVLGVTSPVIDPSVKTSHEDSGFVPVLRAFLFLGMPTLRFCQSLFILGKIAGIANILPSREGNHRLDTQVKTDHLGGDGKRLDVLLYQNGDEVAVGAILSDRDRTGLTVLRQGPMPMNIQRVIHLGKSQCAIFPLEGIGGRGSRLAILLFLEGGVLGTTLKEVDKRPIQVAKGLLQGNRRDITQPGMLFLEIRKHESKLVVIEFLTTLFVGSGAGIQTPIVDEAGASERLSKSNSLLRSGIEPEFVRQLRLAHGLFAFLLLLDMLLNRVGDLAIRRSLILLSNFLEPLKKRGVNVDRKSLWFHTGSVSLFHLCIKGYSPPQPKPQKGMRALHPHVWKARGFRARVRR